MNKIIFPLFTVASLLISTMTNAALITETWTGTIVRTGLDDSLIGSTFNVILTYDNASAAASEFWDGDNGIAEFGMGDDTISYTQCTESAPITTSCDIRYSQHDFISQAQINLDEAEDLFKDYNPISIDEGYSTNMSSVHEYNGFNIGQYFADYLFWSARLDGGEYVTSFYHDGTGPDIAFGETSKSFVATYALAVREVAEPSTFGLIAFFSTFLGFARLRRSLRCEPKT
jgi:hypothetical protein